MAWHEKIFQFEFWEKQVLFWCLLNCSLVEQKIRDLWYLRHKFTQSFKNISIFRFDCSTEKIKKQKLLLSKFRNSRFCQIWMTWIYFVGKTDKNPSNLKSQKFQIKLIRKESTIVESKVVKIQIVRIHFLRHSESNFFVYNEKQGGCNWISWDGNIECTSGPGLISFQISVKFFNIYIEVLFWLHIYLAFIPTFVKVYFKKICRISTWPAVGFVLDTTNFVLILKIQ